MLHGKILKKVLLVGGKLTFNHVKGGVILVETDFTIKGNEFKSVLAKKTKE